jgi:TonB-like protein
MKLSIGLALVALAGTAQQPAVQPVMVPPQLAQAMNERLAIDLAKGTDDLSIPLDADGSRTHGVLFDRMRLGALKMRAQIAAGETPALTGAQNPSGSFIPLALVVVAYPIVCDGRTNAPQDVQYIVPIGPAPGPVRRLGEPLRGAAARTSLPGFEIPEQALAVTFVSAPTSNAEVRITYADAACPGSDKEIVLPIRAGAPRMLQRVDTAKLPDELGDSQPAIVRVHGIIDFDGRLRYSTALDGPTRLQSAAVAAAEQWRFAPARLNGAPMQISTTLTITFTQTGAPVALAASSGRGATGDPTHDTTSATVSGLTAATSACAISDDATYGMTPENPVKTGGDARIGPTREVSYLNVLRGPAGQGIRFRRLGSVRSPDNQTILDIYELTYDGLAPPLRLYLDEYHFDAPKAPKGLVCAAPITLTDPAAPGPASAPPGTSTSTSPAPAAPMATTPDVPGLTAASSKCAVSDDDGYGISAGKPIQIGGGAGAAALETQFMSVLRGPAGQGLRYRRAASVLAADTTSILDSFEVTYAGLEKPVRLFFDRSHDGEVKAPKGFACAADVKR